MTATRVGGRRIYEVAACNDGSFALFRSGDRAKTWRRAYLPPGLHDTAGATVAFVSRRTGFVLYALYGDRGRLYRTVDGGRSWRRASVPSASGFLAADGRVFVYDRHEIYSTAGDARLHRIGRGIGPQMFDNHGVLYDEVAFDKNETPAHAIVLRGARESRELLPCRRQYAFASALTGLPDGSLVDVCGSEPGGPFQLHRTYSSTDEGATWHRTHSPEGLAVDEGAASRAGGFVAGSRGTLQKLSLAGGHWATVSQIAGDDLISNLGFSHGRYGWVLTFTSLWLTNDGGQRWHRATTP